MDNLNLDTPEFRMNDLNIVSTNMLSEDELDSILSSPDDVTEINEEEEKEKAKAKAIAQKQAQQQQQQQAKPKPQGTPKKDADEEKELSEEELLEQALGDEDDEENKQVKDKNTKPKTDPKEDENEEEDKDEELSQFARAARDFKELGLFSEDTEVENINTPQDFLEAVKANDERRGLDWLDDFFGRFGEDRQQLANAVFFNGVEPQEYLGQFVKVEDLKGLDLTIAGNQERVLRQYYASLPSWDTNRVEAKIERLKGQDAIEEDATEKYELLVAQEDQKLVEIEKKSQQQLQDKQRIQQEYMTNVQRILTDKLKTKDFDGIPVTTEFAQETAAFMTQNRYKLPNGELLTEFDKELLELRRPENHEKKVKLGMLLQILKKDPTLSKMKKIAVSEESKELFANLQKEKNDKKKKTEGATSWFK